MIKEDKELWKDLSTRLFHEVICKVKFKDSEGWKIQDMSLKGIFTDECYFTTDTGSVYSKEIKPYLRPLSSITEEENEDLYESGGKAYWILSSEVRLNEFAGFKESYRSLIWLVRNHFDCFNLLDQGLAIEITENDNPYKN